MGSWKPPGKSVALETNPHPPFFPPARLFLSHSLCWWPCGVPGGQAASEFPKIECAPVPDPVSCALLFAQHPRRTCRSQGVMLVPPASISPPATFFLTRFLFFLSSVSPSSTSPCLHLVSIWTKQMFFHFLNVLYTHLTDV